jgi:hypothetical protein
MSTDPTEHSGPLEPMQGVYYNPYELTSPYHGDILPPPPPPPKQSHKGLIVALISVSCLVVLLGGVLFAAMRLSTQPGAAQVTPAPTLALTAAATPTIPPTATPTIPPTATPTTQAQPGPIDAVAIYNDIAPQLDPATHFVVAIGYDYAWQGWPYKPERSAFMWYDHGLLVEVAAFTTPSEVTADAVYNNVTQGKKYQADAPGAGTCMLLYDIRISTTMLEDYFRLLEAEPGCKV